MLLPLLMNLDMFSEPEPVTDFRGRAQRSAMLVYTATHEAEQLYTATHSATIVYAAKGTRS